MQGRWLGQRPSAWLAALGVACLVAATLAVAGIASAAWTALVAVWSGASALLQGSVIVQSMFGTTLAGTVMALTASVMQHVRFLVMGAVCTTVTVTRDRTLYQALVAFLTQGQQVRTQAATATVAQEEILTASNRFKLLKRALRRRLQWAQQRAWGPGKAVDAVACVQDQEDVDQVQLTAAFGGLPMVRVFGGRVLALTVHEDKETIEISVPGRRQHGLVQAFLQHVLERFGPNGTYAADSGSGSSADALANPAVFTAVPADDAKGTVHTKWHWVQARELRARSRDTLFLPGNMLDRLLADAEQFFSSADTYEQRQQPFRRGWMLHGPPGTGKSTVPLVVASELGLSLYVLDVGHEALTDDALRELLTTAPVPSLVVLEDVDAASRVVHQRLPAPGKTRAAETAFCLAAAMGDRGVTLAGLLNVLDGLMAHEGHLVIMTTNHFPALDAALVRPGRCDLVEHVPLATRDQVAAMFMHEFPTACQADLEQFTATVRPHRFSPAAVSEYLQRVRGDLPTAISEDSLCTLRSVVAEGGLEASTLSPGLFRSLWQQGVEVTFPWALAAGAKDNTWQGLTLMAIMDYVTGMVNKSPNILMNSADEVSDVFLSTFPKARREAVQFGAEVMGWCRREQRPMTCIRVTVYLRAHCHDPQEALARVGDWLLTYRRTGANLMPVLPVRFVLYFYGVATHVAPEAFDKLVAEVEAAGVTDGSLLVDMPETVGALPSEDKKENEAMTQAKEIVRRVHARPFGGLRSPRAMALHRADMALMLANAYEDEGVTFDTAMRALRPPLTSLDGGRSGFSSVVFPKLVTTCATLQECLDTMAAAQDLYCFPPVFRGPPRAAALHA